MLDIKLIRENPEIIRKDLEKRRDKEKLKLLENIIKLDKEWRTLKSEEDVLRKKRNDLSKLISEKKKAKEDVEKEIKEVKEIPDKINKMREKRERMEKEIKRGLMNLPNILHESVPYGKDDTENEVVKEFGKKPEFDFELVSHVDLIEDLDLADIARAAKISGSRFYFLKNDLVMLDFALQKYAIDFLSKRGFQLVYPPFMMNRKSYEGVTDLSDFEDVMYKIEGEDLYLIATSEHPLTAMYMDEIIDVSKPIKMAGISACFRKEAGSHGKDTKGIFRVHQFNKIEQIVFCHPDESWKLHEELRKNAEEFFESLGLHFRTVNICTGDIGTVASKKYDLEVWMPVQGKYREIVSCSNCTDYQARRLNIRYREGNSLKEVHTLNSTCVATSRAIVAILENFQTEDGRIKIPDVLRPYMGGKKYIESKKTKDDNK